MNNKPDKKETIEETFKRIFSLKEDKASNDEIRLRLLAGAAYLFTINAYFICLSAVLILSLMKIPKQREFTEKEWKKHRFRMIRNTIIVTLPSIYVFYSIAVSQ